MRFAAIADIHGNAVALQAVLNDIDNLGIDNVVNLGDHLSGPLEAARTADILIERGILSIAGDQDRRLIECHRAGGVDRIDYRQLQPRHLNWLAELPATMTWRADILLCHGTLEDDAEYLLEQVNDGRLWLRPQQEIEALTDGIDASLILCGHSHLPRAVRLQDKRLIVNPGSVGCPGYILKEPVPHIVETGTPDACYAILEMTPSGWSATFRFVPYDHQRAAEMARANGAVSWARALATGRVSH